MFLGAGGRGEFYRKRGQAEGAFLKPEPKIDGKEPVPSFSVRTKENPRAQRG